MTSRLLLAELANGGWSTAKAMARMTRFRCDGEHIPLPIGKVYHEHRTTIHDSFVILRLPPLAKRKRNRVSEHT